MTTVPETQILQPMCVGLLVSDSLRLIGLRAILQENLQLHTVELVAGPAMRSCQPDVVLVDAGLESGAMLEQSVEQVQRLVPDAPVVVLAGSGDPDLLRAARAMGALGYLAETADVDEIRACLQDICSGRSWLPAEREEVAVVSQSLGPVATNLASRFTPKEKEVLQWLTQGRSNREIAATMSIDEATVKAHLGRMLRKAKATNRVELTLRVLAEEA